MLKKQTLFLVVLAALFISSTVTAAYPEKPVTFMVPYGAGGGTDVTARMLAEPLEDVLGVPVTVQNIQGGGGWIGWSQLAHAKPDGYFVGYTNVPNMYAGYLDPNLKRDESLESFTPIILHVVDPCIWAVTPDSPFNSLEDLVEYARNNPGEVSINAHGYGGDDDLAIRKMIDLTGVELKIVNNNSTSESITQVLGGHIDVLAANVGEIKNKVVNGELRALGVMWEERSEFLPEVPTFLEQGYDVVMFAGRVISGPAGLPDDITTTIQEAIITATEDPAYQKRTEELGLQLDLRTGDPLMKFLKKNEQMVKELMGW